MSDRDLANEVDSLLRKTTISYPQWQQNVKAGKYTPKDGSTTAWGQAFNVLTQIDPATPPPPPPPPSTLTIGLTMDKTGGKVLTSPSNAANVEWARNSTLTSSDPEYATQALSASFSGTSAKPWVSAIALDSAGNKIGTAFTARLQTTQAAPPPPPPPPPPGGKVILGVIANVAGYGKPRWAAVEAIGAKILREDRGDWGAAYKAAHPDASILGICWLDANILAVTNCDEIELDNEPYWTAGLDPRTWAQKALACAQAIRAKGITKPLLLPLLSFANNEALGSGFDGKGNYTVSGVSKPWVQWVNEGAPGIWALVQGFAIHPYSPDMAWSPTSMDTVRAQLQAIPDAKDKPFHITEFGWATGGNDTSTDWATTEATQAAWFADALPKMMARSDVAKIYVYQLVDQQTSNVGNSEMHYGLLHDDQVTQKPAYAKVKALIA